MCLSPYRSVSLYDRVSAPTLRVSVCLCAAMNARPLSPSVPPFLPAHSAQFPTTSGRLTLITGHTVPTAVTTGGGGGDDLSTSSGGPSRSAAASPDGAAGDPAPGRAQQLRASKCKYRSPGTRGTGERDMGWWAGEWSDDGKVEAAVAN